MSSTNKTTYYELSQYVGSDKPTYLGDYNSDMLKIDTGLHAAADAADTAVTTANAANSAATSASTTASTALSTAQTASNTASQAQTTAETALTNSGAAQTAAEEAETAARANVITNLAPAYDPSLTYDVGDLVTFIDAQGSGKMYKCIVAVTTPEAFNINKWDDVTVSEVYDLKIITTFVTDGVKTFGDLIISMCQHVMQLNDTDRIKAHYFTLNPNNNEVGNVHRFSQCTSDICEFSNVFGHDNEVVAEITGCLINGTTYTPFSTQILGRVNQNVTFVKGTPASSVIPAGRTYYLAII